MLETISTIMTVASLAHKAYKVFTEDNLVPEAVEQHFEIGEDHFIAPLFGLLAIAGPSYSLGQKLFSKRAKGINTGSLNRTADYDELLQRFAFARINVSLWSHCCRADGKLAAEEDHLTNLMIASLFDEGSLLAEVTNRDLALKELIETFNNPLPVETIAEIIRNVDDVAASFYQEACLIMSVDGSIEPFEREFLNSIANEFGISQSYRQIVEMQYLRLSEEPPKVDAKYRRESLL